MKWSGVAILFAAACATEDPRPPSPCGSSLEYVIARPAGSSVHEHPSRISDEFSPPLLPVDDGLVHVEVAVRGPVREIYRAFSYRLWRGPNAGWPDGDTLHGLQDLSSFWCDSERGDWILSIALDVGTMTLGPDESIHFYPDLQGGGSIYSVVSQQPLVFVPDFVGAVP